ncbi:MAG: glycosyltransferase [Lentisphaeria bacterium]|nr:glycosyltransferase [Lentisphaeria bacterium]
MKQEPKFIKIIQIKKHYHSFILEQKLSGIEDQFGKIDLIIANLKMTCEAAKRLNRDNIYFAIRNNYSLLINDKYRHKPQKIKNKIKRLEKLYQNQKLIAISDSIKNDLKTEFNCLDKNIDLIFNAFDIDEIKARSRQKKSFKLDDDYIVHIGRFDSQKRHDLLFKAYKHIKTDIKLLLLVDQSEELINLVKEYGLEDRIIIPGFQINPYPIIKSARLSVLSSDYEGLSRAVVESLICGTPVVGTSCPGVEEIFKGFSNKLLVPCNDHIALAQKIDFALNNQLKPDESLFKKFSTETIVDKYLSLIERN